jgi:hypothetical protein
MAIEGVQIIWDLLNSFTGSTYLSAFLIFVIGYVLWLFIFQGDFELALVGNLLLVFILADQISWLKIVCVIILGIWAVPRIIAVFGQQNG